MPLYSPITWVPFLPWAGIAWITWDALSPNLLSSYQLLTVSVYLALYLIASFWHGQVTKLVPAPYLVRLSPSPTPLLTEVRMRSSISLKRKHIA